MGCHANAVKKVAEKCMGGLFCYRLPSQLPEYVWRQSVFSLNFSLSRMPRQRDYQGRFCKVNDLVTHMQKKKSNYI